MLAPLKDMLFVIRELAGLDGIRQLPGFEEATDDTVEAVLAEAAKFNAEVVAPLNWSGDIEAGDSRERCGDDIARIPRSIQALR